MVTTIIDGTGFYIQDNEGNEYKFNDVKNVNPDWQIATFNSIYKICTKYIPEYCKQYNVLIQDMPWVKICRYAGDYQGLTSDVYTNWKNDLESKGYQKLYDENDVSIYYNNDEVRIISRNHKVRDRYFAVVDLSVKPTPDNGYTIGKVATLHWPETTSTIKIEDNEIIINIENDQITQKLSNSYTNTQPSSQQVDITAKQGELNISSKDELISVIELMLSSSGWSNGGLAFPPCSSLIYTDKPSLSLKSTFGFDYYGSNEITAGISTDYGCVIVHNTHGGEDRYGLSIGPESKYAGSPVGCSFPGLARDDVIDWRYGILYTITDYLTTKFLGFSLSYTIPLERLATYGACIVPVGIPG
ncbi:MAG: hypothetical protein GXO43_03910 [Crenarchaeota archaeon]|nr:hypothetical protein [Thermoproteota archaeon]